MTAPVAPPVAPILGSLAQFHWDSGSYLDLMHAEVPDYDLLQDEVAVATRAIQARAILELGTGTGETARRVLTVHPAAELIGIDSSEDMLVAARAVLEVNRVELRLGRIEDPLPAGTFDLVVSALAVHHLKAKPRPSYSVESRLPSAPAGALSWATASSPSARRTRSRRSTPITTIRAPWPTSCAGSRRRASRPR